MQVKRNVSRIMSDTLALYTTYVFFWLLCISTASALDSVSLIVEKIETDDWSLQDANLVVFDIDKQAPQFSLLSAALTLPSPFNDITMLDIRCKEFQWHENYMDCSQGQGRFDSGKLKSPTFDFSFQVQDQQSKIKISRLALFGGKISFYAREKAGRWQITIKAKALKLAKLKSFLALQSPEILQGRADIEIELKGQEDNIKELLVSAVLKKLTLQAGQGKFASEDLMLKTDLAAYKKSAGWQWRNSNRMLAGGLYIDPVYLETQKNRTATLTANGFWKPEQKKIRLAAAKLEHPNTVLLHGSARINHKTGFKIEAADLSVSIPQLQSAAPVYLAPFLEAGLFEGINLAGKVDARLTVKQNVVTDLTVDFKDLMLDDADERFQLNRANGLVNWTHQSDNFQPSFISWQQITVNAIPFQQGQLDFSIAGKQLKLLKKVDLSVLGGLLSIKNFSFTAVKNDNAEVHFEGAVKKLSLAQLSEALNWTPLSGTISGYIPSVRYQDKKLELDGELKMQVFDGEVTIKRLASSGMFSDFARFYIDVELDNLDLNAITRKFQVGNIEGRLSGFANNVYLENWQPVSFYAWLGTPKDDDSRHRISQKAVENIASIGGGGAADLISKGFLGLFDTFGYDKLGFGCYLHQGVCQMMGVEAATNGYYLIKGGGLPRINVIGYNPRLDWDVLIQRLNRIIASNEVVIE